MEKEPEGPRGWLAGAGTSYLTLGMQLALAVIVFFFFGRWLDSVWGTAPWMMLCGLLVGIGGGLYGFIRTVLQMGREADKEMQTRRKE